MPSRIRPQDWTPADGLTLEAAAEEAVRASSSTVVVAGPGAGKTELLAQRACYLLQTGLCPAPKRILAISFKRDAARNLGARVAKRCDPELVRRFDSMTFDAFAKSLLDRFGRGLPEHWRPSDDYEITFAINESKARELIDSISPTSGLSAADIAQIEPKRFYLETFLASMMEQRRRPSNREELAAAILWRRFLHGRQPSTLNFQMIGRLSELLLRSNPKILAALRATYLDEMLGLFVKYFALSRDGRDWPAAIRDFEGIDSVPIMTMHKSKGLEYHTIVFVGLEDSALFNWKDDAHEEGCGFFVAFSRAKMRVIFTFSEQRPRKVGGPAYFQDKSNIKVLYDILEAAGVNSEDIG